METNTHLNMYNVLYRGVNQSEKIKRFRFIVMKGIFRQLRIVIDRIYVGGIIVHKTTWENKIQIKVLLCFAFKLHISYETWVALVTLCMKFHYININWGYVKKCYFYGNQQMEI